MHFPDYEISTTALTSTIPIDFGGGSGILTALCAVKVLARIGDISFICEGCQFTLPTAYTYNANTGVEIRLGSSPTDLTGACVYKPEADNITPGEHHKSRTIPFIYQWSSNFRGYLILVGYSAASGASAGDMLTVETTNIKLQQATFHKPKVGSTLKLT